MKSISLSININIPTIFNKHPFSEINLVGEFLNLRQTESYVKYLADYKLLPFLNSAQLLSNQFENRFKLSVSISGISVKLLERYAPYVLKEMKYLYEKGTIDFLAQHWSNSILPYFVQKEQVRQTEFHRKTIEAVFGHLPTVYMAHSAFNPGVFSEFIPFPECKAVFTCSNQLYRNRETEKSSQFKKTQFLINQVLSHKLQQVASDESNVNVTNHVAPFTRYLRKYGSLVKPLILIFNPLAKNILTFNKWQTTIALLLTKTKSSLYSLSDLEETSNYFSIENNYSEDMLLQFKISDDWMKNNMQKEAFKQFLNIYKTLEEGKFQYLPDAWNYLQDSNNFFYMSDSFFLEEFSNQHFTPFRSPHEAFSSYMNAVSNFWNIKKQNPHPVTKSNFLFSSAFN